MAEYSRIAKGHFTSTGNAQMVTLPFQPDRVEFTNYTLANSAATSQNIISALWDVSMGQGQAVIQGYNATPALIYDTVTTKGISTFSAGQLLQYGPTQVIGSGGSITASTSPTIVVTTANHGLVSGNVVIFQNLYETSTTGMQQIAGIPFVVTVTNGTTFSIPWDTSNTNTGYYTTITGSDGAIPAAASFKQVLYPALYAPGTSYISAIGTGTTTLITTTSAHNLQLGQEVAFRIPTVWGTSQLNSLPNATTPGSPIYGFVTAVNSSTQVTVNINSSAYTAFNVSQPFASFPGEFFPQIVAVGDVNTGGVQYSGGAYYPSPLVYSGNSTTATSTINGPAILGAYVNATYQGFVIGGGAGTVLTTGKLVGANTNVIYWAAYLSDLAVN